MARRIAALGLMLLAALTAGSCSSFANLVILVPATGIDRLKPALEAIAAHHALHPRVRTATTEPCTFEDFTDEPRYLLSLKARRLGRRYEVRLASTPLGARYAPFNALATEIEQSMRALYGRSAEVSHNVEAYPMCSG